MAAAAEQVSCNGKSGEKRCRIELTTASRQLYWYNINPEVPPLACVF